MFHVEQCIFLQRKAPKRRGVGVPRGTINFRNIFWVGGGFSDRCRAISRGTGRGTPVRGAFGTRIVRILGNYPHDTRIVLKRLKINILDALAQERTSLKPIIGAFGVV
jgi:hypothetical protein